jgi:signal transduction histidine kinase
MTDHRRHKAEFFSGLHLAANRLQGLVFMFASCLLATSNWAQEGYEIRWYSDQDGLPQSTVKGLIEDRDGFIWVATESGLAVFDGVQFTSYDLVKLGMKSNRIQQFAGSDATGRLYLWNSLYEWAALEGRRLIPYREPSGPLNVHDEGPVFNRRFGPKVETRSTRTNRYWLGDSVWIDQQADHFYGKQGQQLISHPERPISLVPHAGNCYFFYEEGTYGWYDQNYTFQMADAPLTAGPLTMEQIFWHADHQQLFLLDQDAILLIHADQYGILKTLRIWSDLYFQDYLPQSIFYQQEFDQLIVGTRLSGLAIIRKKPFVNIKTRIGPLEPKYSLHYHDGALWTPEGVHDLTTGAFHAFHKLHSHSTLLDSTYFWTARGEYIVKNKIQGYSLQQIDSVLVTSGYFRFFKDFSGRFWVASDVNLYQLDPKNLKLQLIGQLPARVSHMHQAIGSPVYVGTRDGLYWYDEEKKILEKHPFDGFGEVRSIRRFQPDGPLWITTFGNGIFIENEGVVTALPSDPENYLSYSHVIIRDTAGFFWIPTNRGLFQVLEADLDLWVASGMNPTDRPYYHYFDKGAGMGTNEFNGGAIYGYSWLPDGRLVLPSMNGLVVLNPYNIKQRLPERRLFVSGLQIDDQEVELRSHLKVSQGNYRFVFKIQSPFFGNPYNQYFEYRLVGGTSGVWKPIMGHEIVLGRLNPGNYQLEIRKHQGFNKPYVHETIHLTVPHYIYQHWWFYVLLLLLLTLFLWLAYRLRIRLLHRQQETLQKLVSERGNQLQEVISDLRFYNDQLKKQYLSSQQIIDILAHDIRSPLKYLEITLSDIQTQKPIQQDPALMEDLQITRETCKNLSSYVNQILEIREGQSLENVARKEIVLRSFFEEKAGLFRGMMSAKRIRFENQVDASHVLQINPHLFSVIFQNLLDNAIKNMSNGVLTVQSNRNQDGMEIFVVDSGSGFSEEILTAINQASDYKREAIGLGNGWQMILSLVGLVNADVAVENPNEGGAKVSITFFDGHY